MNLEKLHRMKANMKNFYIDLFSNLGNDIPAISPKNKADTIALNLST
jgi:hypothetical protein